MKLMNIFSAALAALTLAVSPACSDNDNATPQEAPVYDMTGFARGADVSWLTEMEAAGYKWYSKSGSETECLTLLRQMGLNSVRLRVWVDPEKGWCGKDDVIAKAWRAQQLGFRIMIDFHYSDTWADPGTQSVPAAWQGYDIDQLRTAVAAHTTEVLSALKDRGIDVEWVQVGNETPDGFLWELGRASTHPDNFAALVNAGYDAVKGVYPDAVVIVHVDKGDNLGRHQWLFDTLKAHGGKWDCIGMSLYPSDDDWETLVANCLSNISTLSSRYGCKVILSEIGMDYNSPNASAFVSRIYIGARPLSACLGVFYWEPECYSWNSYNKGAFNTDGTPTDALDAFAPLKPGMDYTEAL